MLERRHNGHLLLAAIIGCLIAASCLFLPSCASSDDEQTTDDSHDASLAVEDKKADQTEDMTDDDPDEPSVVDPKIAEDPEEGSDSEDASSSKAASSSTSESDESKSDESPSSSSSSKAASSSDVDLAGLDIVEDYRQSFYHGPKGGEYQKYIVIHDTEGGGEPQGVIDYWDGNGALVAAHFVIGKDGTVVQCVPLDEIAHHAGYGDSGHNDLYGIVEDGRDDMNGTVPIGSGVSDYGMNAWSIGIELVHAGEYDDDYPVEQLEALDKVIAYIDSYYGFESDIIDHKAWRTGNSDTSGEFDRYMANYQSGRSYK